MTQFVYDTTFGGLLSTIFEIYERKCKNSSIVRYDKVEAMVFYENIEVVTDDKKAQRVLKALKNKLSAEALRNIYWCFLSEIVGIENLIFNFIKYVFEADKNIENNFGNDNVLTVAQTARKVGREKHRFEAFVRFEKIANDYFYAPVEPDFNVLPLIVPHFKRRYPAQHWVIYDTKRKYGISYNKDTELVNEVLIDFAEVNHKSIVVFDPEEEQYKELWRTYFKSVNIPARKNMKLHLQHIPKRYWKYLVEKK